MFKTIKSKVIFVIIFSIICITLTTILIIYKNIDINPEDEKTKEVISQNKEKDIQGINLKGTYNENDITIEESKVSKEKVEIEYLQIKGLKDKSIQNKINNEIEEVALNFYKEKVTDLNEVENVTVTVWNGANFGNTVSFEISYFSKIADYSDDFYQNSKGLNYNLITGEKIQFKDLFTSDAPIEDILRKSAYYSLITTDLEEDLSGNLKVKDYGDIEDEIAEIIMKYKKGQIDNFYYTPNAIHIPLSDYNIINISMEEWAEYIAIYNRYTENKDIYESNNIGLKDLYTLTTRYKQAYDYIKHEKSKNYFIEISMIRYQEFEEGSFGKNLMNEKIVNIEKEVQKVKELASQNSNNFYILNYSMDINTVTEDWQTGENYIRYNEYGNSYEVTVHDFEENIEPIIIKYCRNDEYGGISPYVYDFSELLKIEPQTVNEYYNTETGEKIVI